MEQQSVPSSSNPNDAYAVKVEDNEIFMLKDQLDEKCRVARRIERELDITGVSRAHLGIEYFFDWMIFTRA